MLRATVFALALLAAVWPASAATFNVGGFAGNIPIVDVSGPIVEHDDERFALFADALQFAVVRLDSRGGQGSTALAIGEKIRSKGFSTYVSPGRTCASACALIWLAGEPRAKDATARVGFHGLFTVVDGQKQQTAPANAFVGVYLDHLRLDAKAIYFATIAMPDQMSWLTPESGQAFDIAFDTRDEVETTRWGNSFASTVAPVNAASPGAPMPLQPTQSAAPVPPKVAEKSPAPQKRVEVKPPPERTLLDDVNDAILSASRSIDPAPAPKPAPKAKPAPHAFMED